MSITLTVFFDSQYWVGVFERVENETLTVAKAVFGAEPTNEEVHEWVLTQFQTLVYSPAVECNVMRPLATNPKRRMRQAAQARLDGVGTKAQQALQLAHEAKKTARKERGQQYKEEALARKFQLKQEKKKAKHRGH